MFHQKFAWILGHFSLSTCVDLGFHTSLFRFHTSLFLQNLLIDLSAGNIPAKLLLQMTTAFQERGLRDRSGKIFYKDHLHKSRVPVLALAGDRDQICPPEAVYGIFLVLSCWILCKRLTILLRYFSINHGLSRNSEAYPRELSEVQSIWRCWWSTLCSLWLGVWTHGTSIRSLLNLEKRLGRKKKGRGEGDMS